MNFIFRQKIFLLIIFLFLFSCQPSKTKYVKIEGKTMGTTYHITYSQKGEKNFKAVIDSLLVEFNNSVSTFIPTSTISKTNQEELIIPVDEYFSVVFKKAEEVSKKTNGAFDVTVMPLVNAWGFGYTDTLNMDSATVDSLRQLVGFTKVKLINQLGKNILMKEDARIKLDFSAIAKGRGVDLICALLESKGVENYMVEIGGEVRAKGKNENGEWWRIGIDKPIDDPMASNRELKAVLEIQNKSIATSGNYRNFYFKNGKKISHEINPKTGYPATTDMLSVSVIADDCMTADAYATAFMVMGFEKSMEFVKSDTSLSVYFIYAKDSAVKTAWTNGLEKLIVEEEK